ncbi:MAG: hypothetical protein WCA46_20770 [Actinocatenispora sp.]
MGYTTTFTGRVTVVPPLNGHEIDYLERFAGSCRMHRTKGPYFVDGGGHRGQDIEPDVLDGGRAAPPEQPGRWCGWVPSADGSSLGWDGGEKFYDSAEWMAYLIDTFLRPGAAVDRERADPTAGRVQPEAFAHFTFDHTVSGVIEAEGEDEEEGRWRLEVRDNTVHVVRHCEQPGYDEVDPDTDPSEWGDAQWARFASLVRYDVAYVVRDGELHEVDPADGQPAARRRAAAT